MAVPSTSDSAEVRERSRSPRRIEPGEDAAKPAVPAAWLSASKPADGEAAPIHSSTKPKGKGKKGKAGFLAMTASPAEAAGAKPYEDPASMVTGSDLLAMASRFEGAATSGAEELIKEVAPLLRKAATRLGSLEKSVGELSQTLSAAHSMLGRGLAAAGVVGGDLPESDVTLGASMDDKTFMVKKGDEELQAAHRAAAVVRPVSGSGAAGGPLGSKSKEEMEKARQARFQQLEAQQAEKRKEQDAAATKTKAREAMFEQRLGGPAKPLGKL